MHFSIDFFCFEDFDLDLAFEKLDFLSVTDLAAASVD